MVDFKKKLGGKTEKKSTDPGEIYNSLDRASDKGPLRPVQEAVLGAWHFNRRDDKDVILKLHTGQGKTLIGLLILQSKLNEQRGPALYLCPNNFLVAQTCEQARQFGVPVATVDNDLPDAFVNSREILVTSVQLLFNGLTRFRLGARSQEVGAIVLDDAHACIDSIQNQVSIRLPHDAPAYQELMTLFASSLKEQGLGTFADLQRHEYEAVLPVPYWAWYDKVGDVASILVRHRDAKEIKFAWPLIKDMLQECSCVFSGTGLEITPNLAPIHQFGSFARASHRVYMSATVADDSFLIKGLRLPPSVIERPLIYDKERWSGEKMILIPSLIDQSLTRERVVELFAQPVSSRRFGVVALCPSFRVTRDWETYGSEVAKTASIEEKVAALKGGDFSKTLVIVNRYDGIDLPDASCRILIVDSMPFSESILDRYMERCLGDSQLIAAKVARKIEQGLGRSVRGEKDYCVVVLIGPELIKQIRTPSSRQFLSAQTRTQIEIGLEVAEDASAEAGVPLDSFTTLVNQCLKRDEGWKEFYVDRMNSLIEGPKSERGLKVLSMELQAEQKAEQGHFDEAANVVQELLDTLVSEDAEKGWYLQEMARLTYRSSKTRSNQLQISAHKKNRLLLRPREGMVVQKIEAIGQRRIENIINLLRDHQTFETASLAVEDACSRLTFGTESDSFEQALDKVGKLLGFVCQRPDAEWKEGPDNLWCLRDGEFLLIEAKSQVSSDRADIQKGEAEQITSSIAWFQRLYPGAKSHNLMIHPARKLNRSAALLHRVSVMRRGSLEKLTANVRRFFLEFRNIDLRDLSPAQVQNALAAHQLNVGDLCSKYSEEIRVPD
jgi:replicative superfamily II helicase